MDVPFSLSCNFKVQSMVRTKRSPGYLTPFEELVCSLVTATGAVAISQVCANSKQKHKLKSLARLGILAMHRLEGYYNGYPVIHNVLTPGSFPGLVQVLKRLAVTHLLILLDYPPAVCISDEEFVIYLEDVEYRAFVHREPEPVKPFIIKAKNHLSFILAEKYHPEFAELDPDSCRIVLDTEDVFLYPDGTPENIVLEI